METRKITVISTKNQKKSVIMSAATTLAELKADLRQNNIDYEDMTFYEGTSKVELKDNASVLPHDVPYKGKTTNELVFMLTNPNKKIRSGADMSRKEVYAAIKAANLEEACIKKFGYNYTIVKTSDLLSLINEKPASNPVQKKSEKQDNSTKCVDTKARAAIFRLLTVLVDRGHIEDYEATEIQNILDSDVVTITTTKKCKSSYSDNEIDKMFNFIK